MEKQKENKQLTARQEKIKSLYNSYPTRSIKRKINRAMFKEYQAGVKVAVEPFRRFKFGLGDKVIYQNHEKLRFLMGVIKKRQRVNNINYYLCKEMTTWFDEKHLTQAKENKQEIKIKQIV